MVDQAESELTMAEISLNEYREGTLVSDRQLLKGYIESCVTAVKQADAGYEYAKVVAAQGLYTPQQLAADEFTLSKTKLSLAEAEAMQGRLERFTAPRLIKNLEAKIQAVKVDVLAQRAALINEDTRLRRLEALHRELHHAGPPRRDRGLLRQRQPAGGWSRTRSARG